MELMTERVPVWQIDPRDNRGRRMAREMEERMLRMAEEHNVETIYVDTDSMIGRFREEVIEEVGVPEIQLASTPRREGEFLERVGFQVMRPRAMGKMSGIMSSRSQFLSKDVLNE